MMQYCSQHPLFLFLSLKIRGAFPNDESIIKLMYLAMQNIAKKWTTPVRNWGVVIDKYSIKFQGRVPL